MASYSDNSHTAICSELYDNYINISLRFSENYNETFILQFKESIKEIFSRHYTRSNICNGAKLLSTIYEVISI